MNRQLGKSDLYISPVMLGTWALGGWLWGGTEKNDPVNTIRKSVDMGINCIDTAPVYGFGLSEELVGKAVKGIRDKVIIATKCGLVWDDRKGSTLFFETKDLSGKPVNVCNCLRKESILSECDESLLRLGIDEIDLYQCHWPDPGTPIEDALEAFEILKDKGKIRYFGVSNFSVDLLERCVNNNMPPTSDQPKYNLLTRDIEEDILPFCINHNIGVICYSPMEMGLLTGKISPDHKFPDTDTRKNRPWFAKDKIIEVNKALELIKSIGDAYNANFAQIAIAWVFHQKGVTSAIVGARNPEQAESNAKACSLSIKEEDIKTITKAFENIKLDQPFDPAKAKR